MVGQWIQQRQLFLFLLPVAKGGNILFFANQRNFTIVVFRIVQNAKAKISRLVA